MYDERNTKPRTAKTQPSQKPMFGQKDSRMGAAMKRAMKDSRKHRINRKDVK